jgi:transaldolase
LLRDYVDNVARAVNSSNLIGVARARARGETISELGNDYAAFLQYTIWQGASFVTTNPVLIKMAWDINPTFWNARVDDLIRSRYTTSELANTLAGPAEQLDGAISAVNSLVTMAVVEENCRLLRDIFLVSNGNEGYVSLQVNPKVHSDGAAMVTEAKALYADLQKRLGGVPNVVFKLPATAGGLYAAKKLTSEGIGVNITVNFSVFQELGFGAVLDKGHALASCLALMNGRMAFPVRDDLKVNNVEGGVEAARWAGVEVARKAYHGLYDPKEAGGLGIDPRRVKLLIASLRIYGDWLPDISELWGCPIITIFPDVRAKWDSHPREFDGHAVLGTTPPQDLAVMLKGEVFRQAWWMPGDPEEYKPARPLTLDPKDAEAVANWPPVAQTLGQFIDLYDKMGAMVLERMRVLAR